MNDPSARETYQRYLQGRITFDELQRETDLAMESYERSRGRLERPPQPARPPQD